MIALDEIIKWLGLALSLIAIWGWVAERKRSAMEEGKKLQIIEQLRKDVDSAHTQIRTIETMAHATDKEVASMSADIKNILASLERIEQNLMGHISENRV